MPSCTARSGCAEAPEPPREPARTVGRWRLPLFPSRGYIGATEIAHSEPRAVTSGPGHANHLANEMSSVAYWYQIEPHRRFGILPVGKRQPVERVGEHRVVEWKHDRASRTPRSKVTLNAEMARMKRRWKTKQGPR